MKESNYVYRLRKETKLSQNDFATFVGITQSTLSKIENGILKPELNMIRALRESFGVSIDEAIDNGGL